MKISNFKFKTLSLFTKLVIIFTVILIVEIVIIILAFPGFKRRKASDFLQLANQNKGKPIIMYTITNNIRKTS